MGNAPRPALNKAANKAEKDRQAALNLGVQIEYQGETYAVRLGDITPTLAREVRQRTGHSFRRMMELLEEDADIDLIAEAVWIAKRVKGEAADLDSITIDYADLDSGDVTIAQPGAEEVDPSDPEA